MIKYIEYELGFDENNMMAVEKLILENFIHEYNELFLKMLQNKSI